MNAREVHNSVFHRICQLCVCEPLHLGEASYTIPSECRKMSVWHQWLGIVGTIFILGAYFLLQTDRLSSRDLSYSLLNAVGASFLVVSLLFDFNLSALIVESFWALISAVGITSLSS